MATDMMSLRRGSGWMLERYTVRVQSRTYAVDELSGSGRGDGWTKVAATEGWQEVACGKGRGPSFGIPTRGREHCRRPRMFHPRCPTPRPQWPGGQVAGLHVKCPGRLVSRGGGETKVKRGKHTTRVLRRKLDVSISAEGEGGEG